MSRLKADPGYSGLIAKNPLSERWRTTWHAPFPYSLEQLNADLTQLDKQKLRKEEYWGAGRNCTLFDELRVIAYRKVLHLKRQGAHQAIFRERLEKSATGL